MFFYREDWAKKLVHWKNEFVSTLQRYWLGIKLLGFDVRICLRLLVKLGRGNGLSRRERQQLTRTTADIFRLVPVAVFIVVPFMEFLLPVILKLFPNMLPSTFKDKMQEQVLISDCPSPSFWCFLLSELHAVPHFGSPWPSLSFGLNYFCLLCWTLGNKMVTLYLKKFQMIY